MADEVVCIDVPDSPLQRVVSEYHRAGWTESRRLSPAPGTVGAWQSSSRDQDCHRGLSARGRSPVRVSAGGAMGIRTPDLLHAILAQRAAGCRLMCISADFGSLWQAGRCPALLHGGTQSGHPDRASSNHARSILSCRPARSRWLPHCRALRACARFGLIVESVTCWLPSAHGGGAAGS